MSRDRYNILMFGTYANRPAIGEAEQLYTVTSGINQGRQYKGTGSGWVEIPLADVQGHDINPDEGPHTGGLPWSHLEDVPTSFAPAAHDINPDEGPHTGGLPWSHLEDVPSSFTPSAHTHPLADITGYSAKGLIRFTDPPGQAVPTGANVMECRIPALAISGTTLEIIGVAAYVVYAPTSPFTVTFKREGVTLKTITVSASSHGSSEALAAAVELTGDDRLTIDVSSNTYSALGADFQFIIGRRRT